VARALYYSWRVFSNLLQVAIILWVFAEIDNNQTATIVGVLGMIYATIRSGQIMFGFSQMQITNALAEELLRIRKLLNDQSPYSAWYGERTLRDDVMAQQRKQAVGAWIEAGALSIVFLICAFNVFVNV
jgi:hypothetical protein